MTLLQAWADSLSLLKPKNLKLFLLVTVKSIIDAYKVLLKYWWCLFAIIVLLYGAIFLQVDIVTCLWADKMATYFFYDILVFATLVAVRPSLEQKNWAYFRRYIIYVVPVILIYFVPLVLLTLILLPLGLLIPVTVVMSPVYIFSTLFLLDSPGKLKDFLRSFLRALKMVIYNFPLLIVVGVIFELPKYIFNYHVNISPLLIAGVTIMQISAIFNILSILLTPIAICFYTNMYIKQLHGQFDLYFKQPS